MAKDMDAENIKKNHEGKIGFFGAICVQNLVPNGTPDQIKSEVKRITGLLCEKGNYLIAPVHNIQDDTSVENVLAMFEAVRELV